MPDLVQTRARVLLLFLGGLLEGLSPCKHLYDLCPDFWWVFRHADDLSRRTMVLGICRHADRLEMLPQHFGGVWKRPSPCRLFDDMCSVFANM